MRAMNGRNKDQQQEALPHGAKQCVVAALQQLKNNVIAIGVFFMTVVAMELPDEFARGWK
jgi:hypothetical protein